MSVTASSLKPLVRTARSKPTGVVTEPGDPSSAPHYLRVRV